jgi:hypothetical protein
VRWLLPIAPALVGILALTGCGGGGGGAETAGSGNGAVTTEAEITPAGTPAEGAVPWPAPPNPIELAVAAGLKPEVKEFLNHHVHAHLDVFVNGEPVEVPAGVGIDIGNPGVQSGPTEDGSIGYGGIEECAEPCISPLHTHDTTGVLHTESPEDVDNTLGEFFVEWGVALDERCVGGYCKDATTVQVYVDGELYEGNPGDIALTDGKQISIVIGIPPEEIPDSFLGFG